MITQDNIIEFCNQQDYDLRKRKNKRWIDQKCTPDVIWSIADFILDYIDNVKDDFTVRDIWQSEYAKKTIAETYSKPGTDEKSAENEYDKVFSQPLAMFCYAGIIKDISKKRTHIYVIENRDILEYIARNDINALRFLHNYIEKVLKDSELYLVFEEFFRNQDKTSFQKLKNTFIEFYHKNTSIKGEYEPKRIFTKVLNPLAFKYCKKGTKRGHLSKDIIKKSDMMYNSDNFRDIYIAKPKGISRQEWLAQQPNINRRDGYFKQMMSCAKKNLSIFNKEMRYNTSELTYFLEKNHDKKILNRYNMQIDKTSATQIHHIFPKNEFPEIMHYIENLIILTPNQHYNFAHPNNNTQIIDLEAQKILLMAKTYSIKENLINEETPIYEFSNFLTVLSIGWDDPSVLEIKENDYVDIMHTIVYHYST